MATSLVAPLPEMLEEQVTTTTTTTVVLPAKASKPVREVVLILSPATAQSRAVWLLLLELTTTTTTSTTIVGSSSRRQPAARPPVRLLDIDMMQHEHSSCQEFLHLNPSKTVPTMIHGKLILTELYVPTHTLTLTLTLNQSTCRVLLQQLQCKHNTSEAVLQSHKC
jgi:hypothetical protein